MLMSFWSGLVALITYDAYWQVSEDTASSKKADAATVVTAFKQDMFIHTAFEAAAGLILWMNYDAWKYSEYLFLPAEEQLHYVELWNGDHTKILEH